MMLVGRWLWYLWVINWGRVAMQPFWSCFMVSDAFTWLRLRNFLVYKLYIFAVSIELCTVIHDFNIKKVFYVWRLVLSAFLLSTVHKIYYHFYIGREKFLTQRIETKRHFLSTCDDVSILLFFFWSIRLLFLSSVLVASPWRLTLITQACLLGTSWQSF